MPWWIVTNRPWLLDKQMRLSAWQHKFNLSSEWVGPSVSLCCCCSLVFFPNTAKSLQTLQAAEWRSRRLQRQQHRGVMPLMKCCCNGMSQAIKRPHLLSPALNNWRGNVLKSDLGQRCGRVNDFWDFELLWFDGADRWLQPPCCVFSLSFILCCFDVVGCP